MKTSLFELFKIGIGPSSSHTVGPMRAASLFASEFEAPDGWNGSAVLRTELYGSLALTGVGHGTGPRCCWAFPASGRRRRSGRRRAFKATKFASWIAALDRALSDVVFIRERS